ncbi:MAG TPA: GGDEF domain-containing protein [Candidatus Acidoferrum sp.]|nr:GGDEF domain-containing protein [Candidatus Acidoferrum sp.]
MVDASQSDVAAAGRRLKTRIYLALALSSVLPLVMLALVAHVYVLPLMNPADSSRVFTLMGLLFVALITSVTGSYVIWDLGRVVERLATLLSEQRGIGELAERGDDVGTIMSSFSRMLETVERQATEINSFAMRLDAAYKELESTNVRLKETSFKDDVTGLYNRRFFSVRLEEEMSRYRRFNHPVSLVLMDLDGFKAVNDEMGHMVGDETLRDIGQILMKHSRGINVVCRYGGDEFAVLLVETSKAGAQLYADRIRQIIESYPFSHRRPITASFGIASLPDEEATTSEHLIRAADEALYAAKRAGKNQVAAALPHKES